MDIKKQHSFLRNHMYEAITATLCILLAIVLFICGLSTGNAETPEGSSVATGQVGLPPTFFAIISTALIGAAVAIWGIATQRHTARSKNTIDFEHEIKHGQYTENFANVSKALNSKDCNEETVKEWAKKSFQTTEEAQSIRKVLNTWEGASNGVRKKIYDSHFLYDIYGSHVINLYTKLSPFIKEVRKDPKRQRAFDHFIELANEWKEWRKKEERQKEKQRKKTRNHGSTSRTSQSKPSA